MSGKGLLLLVDDEEDIRQNLRDYAEMEGYEVLEAENGEEALRILDREQPGVVISDIMMPVMDGLELLKRIHTGGNDVPVIIMTAFGTIERAVKAMKLGAADFITKPIDLDMMLQVVKRVLTRAELEQKVKQQEQQMKEDLHLASMIQRCMLPQNLDTPLL
nr:response regulator [bacterium]